MLFDVDGVLTDGTLLYGPEGEQSKAFNARDGVAHALLHAHGIATGLVSGRTSPALQRRADDLSIQVRKLGRNDKGTALEEILDDTGLAGSAVAFVGDDVLDLQVIGLVGLFLTPRDAHPLVRPRAHHVLEAPGGRGAAREAAEHVLTVGGLSLEQAYAPLMHDHFRSTRQ